MAIYYTLIVRNNADAPWEEAFGDYDREVVEDEREDLCRHKKSNTKIIKTGDKQDEIEAKIAKLNGAKK